MGVGVSASGVGVSEGMGVSDGIGVSEGMGVSVGVSEGVGVSVGIGVDLVTVSDTVHLPSKTNVTVNTPYNEPPWPSKSVSHWPLAPLPRAIGDPGALFVVLGVLSLPL